MHSFGTNSFYFLCAPYFYDKIDKAGLFEFNPYEKDSVSVPFPMNNNPGFIPDGYFSFTQNFNVYVNENYSHEGVDLAVGAENCGLIGIKSGISGKVIIEGDKGNYSYGCFIVIQANEKHEGKYRYYLLAHLDRNRPHKTEDKKNNYVYPNDIVGYVGNTGHCKSNGINIEGTDNLDLRADGRGAHLHLQMFLTEQPYKSFIEIMKFDTLKDKKEPKTGFVCSDRNIVNPFDYSETYEKDSKK